jgi:hypothetical protein
MAYKDPERQRAYAREWMKRNAEKAREAMRRWRARNPELVRARNRKYRRAARLRDGAKLNAQRAAYLASHPEVKRAKEQAYRARKVAAVGSFTGAEWLKLVAFWGNVCAYVESRVRSSLITAFRSSGEGRISSTTSSPHVVVAMRGSTR